MKKETALELIDAIEEVAIAAVAWHGDMASDWTEDNLKKKAAILETFLLRITIEEPADA